MQKVRASCIQVLIIITTHLLLHRPWFTDFLNLTPPESLSDCLMAARNGSHDPMDLDSSLKRLSRTRENLARNQSHVHFLTTCKEKGILPKGMTLKFLFCALPKIDALKDSIKDTIHTAEMNILTACITNYQARVETERAHADHILYQLQQTVNDQTLFDNLIFSHRRELNNLKRQYNRRKQKKVNALLRLPEIPSDQQPRIEHKSKTKRNRRFIRLPGNHNPIHPNPNLVVNLSKVTLTESQHEVLSLGPKFCPTPRSLNHKQLCNDVTEGCRRVRLKEYHYNPEVNSEPTPPPRFYSPTFWNPPSGRDLAIDAYCTTLQSKTASYKHNKQIPDNLTPDHRTAVEELSTLTKNRQIRITQADKGGAVVVQDTADYINEAHRQLHNEAYYAKLTKDPTPSIAKVSNQLVEKLHNKQLIDDNTYRWALVEPNQTKTHTFYILPKIHKTLVNPPGRPIVSGINGPTEKLSKLTDYWLQDYVRSLPSHIQDTTDMLQTIDRWNKDFGPFPPQTRLVTIDVVSLYSNIPHDELLTSLQHYLDKPLPIYSTSRPPTKDILEIASHVLTNNIFTFESQIYRQIQGTAMGTPMAPAAANLFMGALELKLQTNSPVPFPTRFWRRYIDDIFFLWSGDEAELHTFLNFLNNSHPTIKFTMSHSLTDIPFLDISISLHQGFLHTDLYTKPTDSHAYLPANSCHPSHVIRNIPYSQFLRLLRICSDNSVFTSRCNTLETWLLHRGYKPHHIKQARKKASLISRSEALKYQPKNSTDRPPLIVTYNPRNPPLTHWLSQLHSSIIQTSNRARKAVPLPPILGQRNPPNLRSILMPSVLPSSLSESPGCYQCNSKRCVMCADHLVEATSVTSHHSGKTFQLRNRLSCNSTNIIYLLYCNKCKHTQYIGETKNTLKTRFYLHRSHIKKNTGTLVTQHFNKTNHTLNDMKCIAVERVYGHGLEARLERERAWMARLQTLQPHGLNSNES